MKKIVSILFAVFCMWLPALCPAAETYNITYNTNGGECLGNLISPPTSTDPITQDGITITPTEDGVYTINGTASDDTTILFDVEEFVVPKSKDAGGTGSLALYNSMNYQVSFLLYSNEEQAGVFGLNLADRFFKNYDISEETTINKIGFSIAKDAVVDNVVVRPALYNDGRTEMGDYIKGKGVCFPKTYTAGVKTKLPKASKEGYVFGGWYVGDSSIAQNYIPADATGDKTLYAKWTCNKGYYLSVTNVCTKCGTGYFCPGGAIGQKYCPSDAKHSDAGAWTIRDCYAILTLNGNGGTSGDEGELEVHAHSGKRTSSYDPKCGISDERLCKKSDKKDVVYHLITNVFEKGVPFSAPAESDENYVFAGWCKDENCSKLVTTNSFTGDNQLYAKWGCKRGYYGKNGICTQCPGEKPTTAYVGAEEVTECKTEYTYGDGNQMWTWPNAVKPCTNQNCTQ